MFEFTNNFNSADVSVYYGVRENYSFNEEISLSATGSSLVKRQFEPLADSPSPKFSKLDLTKIRYIGEWELHIQKKNEVGKGNYKKVNLAHLCKDDEAYLVVFAKFLKKNQNNEKINEREKYILNKLVENYPNGCRGLMTCLGIYQWESASHINKTGFISPFYNGQTLKEANSISKKEALIIALDIAYGLKALHAIKILHNDFKYDNICLERDPITFEIIAARIIDLGMATDLEEPAHILPINSAKAYASPELSEKLRNPLAPPINEKSDIYSFGKLLFNLLPSPKDSIATLMIDSQIEEAAQRPTLDEFITVLEALNTKYTTDSSSEKQETIA